MESSSAAFFPYRKNATVENVALNIHMKEMYQVLLFAEFILEIDRKIFRWIFLVDFELGS